MPVEPLPSDYLYTPCDLNDHAFKTTRELEAVPGLVGQERALEALTFGTRIKRKGYNLFVLGSAGAGKHSAVIGYLQEEAKKQKPPSDWVYVNNFDVSHKPIALELPSGQAQALKGALQAVLDDLKVAVPAILESEEYKTRRQAIEGEYANRQNHAFERLGKRAEDAGIALLRTPGGLVLAPAKDGEVLKPEEFNKRPKEERERVERVISELQKELGTIIEQIPAWEKEKHQRLAELNRAIAVSAVSRAMRTAKSDFARMKKIADWLAGVEEDLVGHIGFFAGADMDPSMRQPLFGAGGEEDAAPMRRYEVNIIVDGAHPDNGGGAPVVYADHPTFANVVGRVEHISRMGALLTDYRRVRRGAFAPGAPTAPWIAPGVLLRVGVGLVVAAGAYAWTSATYEQPRALSADFLNAPTVVTWNINGGVQPGVTGGPAIELGEMASALVEGATDVVMLQEVERGSLLAGGTDTLEYFAGVIDLPYAYASAGDHRGVAVFTSRAHTNPHALALPAIDGPRDHVALAIDFMGATYATAQLAGPVLDADRAAQAEQLIAWLDAPQPTVLGGDLGAEPGTPVLTLFRDAGLVSAQDVAGSPGPTYLGTDPSGSEATIRDYVLGRGVEFSVFGTVGLPWSDHLPVVTRGTTGAVAPTDAVTDVNEPQPDAGPSPSPTASPTPSASPSNDS